ncbi:MAG TPA: sulfur carrier protein ThiS adenylyltransferase ThiF [Firmicutes bacterium]|nr:sulfur carrier protein ThiS adenylyltransferase ThiF [Bacillota bacterium]
MVEFNTGYPDEIKKKLKTACVGIAGLGGLGSNAAVSLTRAGVGKLILVDFDKIEQTNLNRQFYFKEQIGKYKTEALNENLKRINPDIELILKNEKLVSGKMFEPFTDTDIIIEALDTAEMKAAFIEEVHSKLHHIPLIAASGVAGYGKTDGIFTKQLGTLFIVYNPEAPSSEEGLLLAPMVNIIANWEADLAIKIILDGFNADNS